MENDRNGHETDGNPTRASFQERVRPWMLACFGPEVSSDRTERNHRFLEEALELAQANECSRSEAVQLLNYVFDRPVGEVRQEVGGVMVTLAALCLALGEDMHEAGEAELARIWTKVEAIRAKRATKPAHSPLPQPAEPKPAESVEAAFRFAFEAAFRTVGSGDNSYVGMEGLRDAAWERYCKLHGIASTESPQAPDPENGSRSGKQWRCFHCDESFADFESARAHFGDHELCDPVCCMKAEDLRAMERELERYRAEDSDKDREFHARQANHIRALRVEEEKGYEKGLRDGEELFGEPYAWEYGRSNGDGTFSVVIERGRPVRPVPDWPVKALYSRQIDLKKPLARFGHHHDPAEDFVAEVSGIERQVRGLLDSVDRAGLEVAGERVFQAMSFRAGGIEAAVSAKYRLRQIEKDLKALGYGTRDREGDETVSNQVKEN